MIATYSKFILETQLNTRTGTVADAVADVTAQAVPNRNVSRRERGRGPSSPNIMPPLINRAQANTIKFGAYQNIINNSILLFLFAHFNAFADDLNPSVVLDRFDPYSNDDVDENAVDSTVANADENVDGDVNDEYNQADGEDDVMTETQPTIESKPNLSYGFRDRNSAIFRRRRIINGLLRSEVLDRQQQQNQRPQTNPRKRKPMEKKHKCDQCSYATPSRSRLKEHLVVHSGEKAFECDVCKERMSYRHSLKQHALRRHGILILN